MKWDSSFAIGIDAIDKQHQKIFEHLLAIENSVAKRDPWHILRFLLSQLSDYMKFHLAVEEALLEVIRYPGLAEHRGAHGGLLQQIAELEERLARNAVGENLVEFFEQWFIRHVLSGDREYAAYIKEKMPRLLDKEAA